MATTTWRSSLANIETKLRRGLGITGPIDLELAPKQLTPVILVQDLTRAGNASQLRGRRWMVPLIPNSIAIGAQGSVWIIADPPYISTGTSGRPNAFEGGIQIDQIEVDMYTNGAAQQMQLSARYWASDLVAAGLPLAVTDKFSIYVDPQRTATEVAPIFTAVSNTVAPNAGAAGQRIWNRSQFGTDHHYTIPVDIFLNWGAGISLGTHIVASSLTNLSVTFSGHIF